MPASEIGPAPQPHGQGRPLSDSEQGRFAALVADLSGDRPRVSRPRPARVPQVRQLTAKTGWPVWVSALIGVLLILWGGLADAGVPLLIGVVVAGTSPQWLRLPALSELWLRQG